MAVTGNAHGFFWDSNNGDRTYSAESFEVWLRKFFTSGVFQNELAVTSTGGLNLAVSAGYANCNGKVMMFGASAAVDTAGANPRIDTVVVERNDNDRTFYVKVVKGAYNGANPQPTAPVRSGGVYQLVLAEVRVESTSITQGNITDKRPDSSVCGWVTGTVDEIDLQQVLAQSEAQFNEWFDEMKGQLSTDAAGSLQLQIDNILDEDESISESNLWQHLQACALSESVDSQLSAKMNKRVLTSETTGSTTGVVYFASQKATASLAAGDGQRVAFTNIVNANYLVLGAVSFGAGEGAYVEMVEYNPEYPRTFYMNVRATTAGQKTVRLVVAAIHKNWLNS